MEGENRWGGKKAHSLWPLSPILCPTPRVQGSITSHARQRRGRGGISRKKGAVSTVSFVSPQATGRWKKGEVFFLFSTLAGKKKPWLKDEDWQLAFVSEPAGKEGRGRSRLHLLTSTSRPEEREGRAEREGEQSERCPLLAARGKRKKGALSLHHPCMREKWASEKKPRGKRGGKERRGKISSPHDHDLCSQGKKKRGGKKRTSGRKW